ncbi:hypothetical protein LCGC14_0903660 [marine sediment metagenome]|uniref:Tyr recombinase domain-containing protein n=1 Tax=marine sediment metagenome TaxID=412755 RepID=A0A0F9REN5_9ZZZZ
MNIALFLFCMIYCAIHKLYYIIMIGIDIKYIYLLYDTTIYCILCCSYCCHTQHKINMNDYKKEFLTKFSEHIKLATSKRVDGMSESSVRFLSKHVRDFVDDINIESFGRNDVSRFISNRTNLSLTSKSTLMFGLGKFLYWNMYISKDDFLILQKAFRAKADNWGNVLMTTRMVSDFIQGALHSSFALSRARDPWLLFILGSLGPRISQVLDLTSLDVRLLYDENMIELTLVKKKDTRQSLRKNIDIKYLPFDYKINNFVAYNLYTDYIDFLDQNYHGCEYHIINSRGDRLSDSGAGKQIKRYADLLGYEGTTAHCFRHYVCQAVCASKGIANASILMGHSSLDTTKKYINPAVFSPKELLI